MFSMLGFSKINIKINEIKPQIKNSIIDNLIPSTLSEYLSITIICKANPKAEASGVVIEANLDQYRLYQILLKNKVRTYQVLLKLLK